MDLLEEVRLAARQSEPLEVQRRRARLEAQRRGDRNRGRLGPGGDQAGLGVQAALLHLVREAGAAGDVALQARSEDERAASAGPLDAPLLGELPERPADGDQADAVVASQLTLRREAIARLPRPVVQGFAQVEIDLVVHRDGAEREAETGHRGWRLLEVGRGRPGLRGPRLLITL